MLDVEELMAKVGKIRILTNRLVDDRLSSSSGVALRKH